MALRSFREGDRVKAVILSVDTEKRRISLGLKPSYFGEEMPESDEDEQSSPGEDNEPLGVVEDEEDQDQVEDGYDEALGESDEEESEDDDAMDVDAEAISADVNIQTIFSQKEPKSSKMAKTSGGGTLDLGGGFQWSADQDGYEQMSDASSEDDDEGDQSGKKKKKRKEIEQDLTADMHTKTPESNADFERVLLGSPNSSYLWIQYMSFQLQLSEVEKAREIARRALKTISFREEQEKLNVWIALLNLENVYGTEESLETTFKDAARHNDSKTVHLRMATIFDESEKFEVYSSDSGPND